MNEQKNINFTDAELGKLEIALSTHLKMIDKELKIATGEDKANLIYAKKEYEELYHKISGAYYRESSGLVARPDEAREDFEQRIKSDYQNQLMLGEGTYIPFNNLKVHYDDSHDYETGVASYVCHGEDDDLFDDLDDDLPFFEPQHQITEQ